MPARTRYPLNGVAQIQPPRLAPVPARAVVAKPPGLRCPIKLCPLQLFPAHGTHCLAHYCAPARVQLSCPGAEASTLHPAPSRQYVCTR